MVWRELGRNPYMDVVRTAAFAKAFYPVFGIVTDFVHKAAGYVAGSLDTLLPRAHCFYGNAQELGKNRLASSEKLARSLDLLGTVGLRFQLQFNRPAGEAFGNCFLVF